MMASTPGRPATSARISMPRVISQFDRGHFDKYLALMPIACCPAWAVVLAAARSPGSGPRVKARRSRPEGRRRRP